MLFTSGGIARDRRHMLMPLARLRLPHLMAVLLTVALQLPATASGVLAADYQGTLKIRRHRGGSRYNHPGGGCISETTP